jgi:hypothetical protein
MQRDQGVEVRRDTGEVVEDDTWVGVVTTAVISLLKGFETICILVLSLEFRLPIS